MSCCFTKRKRVANCYSSDEENALPTKTDDVSIFAHTIFLCMYVYMYIHTYVCSKYCSIRPYVHMYIYIYITFLKLIKIVTERKYVLYVII